jgi:hypothetical protein
MSDELVRMVPREQIDDGLRPAREMRVALDEEAIGQYAEDLSLLPPVRLKWDEAAGHYWVVDGAHTISAAASIEEPAVRAIVTEGDYWAAFREAARCNGSHGVRITNADKGHRVGVALRHPDNANLSSRQIAELCGVSPGLVDKRRGQLPTVGNCEDEKRVGKDGKKYPSEKKKGGKKPRGDGRAAAPEGEPREPQAQAAGDGKTGHPARDRTARPSSDDPLERAGTAADGPPGDGGEPATPAIRGGPRKPERPIVGELQLYEKAGTLKGSVQARMSCCFGQELTLGGSHSFGPSNVSIDVLSADGKERLVSIRLSIAAAKDLSEKLSRAISNADEFDAKPPSLPGPGASNPGRPAARERPRDVRLGDAWLPHHRPRQGGGPGVTNT